MALIMRKLIMQKTQIPGVVKVKGQPQVKDILEQTGLSLRAFQRLNPQLKNVDERTYLGGDPRDTIIVFTNKNFLSSAPTRLVERRLRKGTITEQEFAKLTGGQSSMVQPIETPSFTPTNTITTPVRQTSTPNVLSGSNLIQKQLEEIRQKALGAAGMIKSLATSRNINLPGLENVIKELRKPVNVSPLDANKLLTTQPTISSTINKISAGVMDTARNKLITAEAAASGSLDQLSQFLEQQSRRLMEQTKLNLQRELARIRSERESAISELETKLKIPEARQALEDLRSKIAANIKSLENLRAGFREASEQIRTQPIPKPFITGQLAALERRQQIEEANQIGKIRALQAEAEAIQGNLTEARQAMKDYMDLTFLPLTQEVALAEEVVQQLAAPQRELLEQVIEERKRTLEEQANNKQAILKLFESNPLSFQKAGLQLVDALEMTPPEVLDKIAPHIVAEQQAKGLTAGGVVAQLPQEIGGVDTETWRNAIQFASLGQSTKTREQSIELMNDLLAKGDTTRAKEWLVRVATDSATAEEQKQALARLQAIEALNYIDGLFKKVKGIQPGIIGGNLEKVANRLRLSANPELAAIGVELTNLLMTYRRSMTGVAFREEENRDYKKIIPDINDIGSLRTAKLNAFRDMLDRYQRVFLANRIGETNYDRIFGGDEEKLDTPPVVDTATTDEIVNFLEKMPGVGQTVSAVKGAVDLVNDLPFVSKTIDQFLETFGLK